MAITNANPRTVHSGMKDETGRALPYEPELIPQHLPLFMIQTQTGPASPQLVVGGELNRMYGNNSFNQRSKYYSHQTHAALRANGEGNMLFIKRLFDSTATKANMVLWLEVILDEYQNYLRNSDGSVQTDSNGIKLIDTGGDAASLGYTMKWHVLPLANDETVDNLVGRPGSLTGNKAGETSTMYPMFAFEHGFMGADGNNLGINMWLPHERSQDPGDFYTMDLLQTSIYRFRTQKRTSLISTPSVIETKLGQQYTDIAFDDDVINDRTNRYYTDNDIVDAYEVDEPGQVPVYSDIGDFKVYKENWNLVTELVKVTEDAKTGDTIVASQINLLNSFDQEGNDFWSTRFTTDSAQLNSNTTHYFQGGSDGTVDEATLGSLVKEFIDNDFDNTDAPLVDVAQYPFSTIYDTGFPIETKYSILTIPSKRPDVNVAVCTQDLSLKDNDLSTEDSMGVSLRAAARLIPESSIHGTAAVRAVITGQVGTDTTHITKRRFPLIMDLITKRARYMGAGNGFYKSEAAYDQTVNNWVKGFVRVTHPYKKEKAAKNDWENGVNTVRHFDRQNLFWPALQTVYNDDTSVLNSDINMMICCDVIRKQHLVWASLTGNLKLTEAVFLQKSDKIMKELVFGKYDGRVTFEINSYVTPADSVRGWSWTMDAIVYMNNMKTVASMNITTRRAADLAA